MNLRDAKDKIDMMARQYEAMTLVSEMLEKAAFTEDRIKESDNALAKLKAAIELSKEELVATKEESFLMKKKSKALLEDAAGQASEAISSAKEEAASLVAAAKEKAKDEEAKLTKKSKDAIASAESAAVRLADIESQIATLEGVKEAALNELAKIDKQVESAKEAARQVLSSIA